MTSIRSVEDLRRWLGTPITQEDKALFSQAARLTRRHFGRAMDLFTPLYLSNHCQNGCLYCGFHAARKQVRKTLNETEILLEARAIAADGHGSLLLLTGEAPREVPPSYLTRAVEICRPCFSHLAMEVYPLETDDYRRLMQAGLDGVTLYQETYNRRRYDELHPYGPKKDYAYRIEAPRRLLSAGIPFLTMGILLGLSDPADDLSSLFRHYRALGQQFPAADIGLSFPRLRPVEGDLSRYEPIPDDMLLKIIALTRLTFPRSAIVLSTRESEAFRRQALEIGVTRMSAASRTGVGGHAGESASDDQFTVQDDRSLAEIKTDLAENGFEPVACNWHNLQAKT